MSKKECPSCAMNIPADADSCPVCGYEFPSHSSNKRIAWILLIILLVSGVLGFAVLRWF